MGFGLEAGRGGSTHRVSNREQRCRGAGCLEVSGLSPKLSMAGSLHADRRWMHAGAVPVWASM